MWDFHLIDDVLVIYVPCIGDDACPVSEGQGSWRPDDMGAGGRNYNGPKVAKFLVG